MPPALGQTKLIARSLDERERELELKTKVSEDYAKFYNH